VKDGKLTANNGKTYRVEGDKILSDTGAVVFYLSGLYPDARGDGDLATQLFGSGE
jgi:hypothetical protein